MVFYYITQALGPKVTLRRPAPTYNTSRICDERKFLKVFLVFEWNTQAIFTHPM